MATKYRKRVPKRAEGKRRDHGGVPQLAAQIAGVSVYTVYAVIYGRVKSAHVTRAIKDARQQLRNVRRKAA
jgi:hypothetical protein